MDSADMCAAVSSGDDNQLVKKKRDWHKRLRLRKTAVQPPTMQGRDKAGPKKIAKRREPNTDCPPLNGPLDKAKRGQHKALNSSSMLRFKCSRCNDQSEFVPKELARHFQEKHKGNQPDFSCHVCSFKAHKFSSLQVHLLSHKDTFPSCNICKDNVQRTLPEYCSHLTSCHCQKGRFSCELCDKFSTREVHAFLQHMHLHDLPMEERGELDLSLHTTDFMKPVRSKAAGPGLQCQHCGYRGPSKRLITKHMNTVHAGETADHNMKELHRITNSPHPSAPKMRNRVTRNTARDMRWLSRDCLSMPGREFLDKYCSLSSPERTLEETQQFLVRSAVGGTDGQKWTKALQSVLSSFPQDLNMHPKLENAMMSNSSKDLNVLMVKNKLKVPQNSGSYVKKTTPPEKIETSPSGSAHLDTNCVFDPNRGQPQLGNDQTHCPGTQNNINEDPSIAAMPESAAGRPIQENRENQESRLHQNVEEHSRNGKEIKCDHSCEDGLHAAKEPKTANKRDTRTPAQRKYRGRRGGRTEKSRPKALEKQLQGLGLKLVLKKDPVKNKQWMSQSPLLPPEGCLAGDRHGLLPSLPAVEQQVQPLVNEPSEENAKVSLQTDLRSTLESIALQSRPRPGELFSVTRGQCCGNGNAHRMDVSVPSDATGKPKSQFASTNGFAENLNIPTATLGASGGNNRGTDNSVLGRKESGSIDAVNPLRNNGAMSPHAAKALVPSLGPPVHSPPEDPGPPPGHTASNGPPAAVGDPLWPVAPRAAERTLRLTPLSPGQAVKRPRGEQPVVVLNHPDAAPPQVVRLMAAVHRHRGAVQRVVLSRRTLDSISPAVQGAGAAAPPSGPPSPAPPPPAAAAACRPSRVRERFLLRLRLRRTSRRKYRVVRGAGDATDPVAAFRCWFCGRGFGSRSSWTGHQQRHLMEWRAPHCEETDLSPTLEKVH
ncbi:uncharacterized protein LOC132472997 [Gadus macrocephalus]|uniref:uncharacterized protein LOC132472997 n=1 Tax=Gadus macrocephalus TaxID=80720 RepID=UPI0028CBA25E|nr:uncharacterized protein LOC132472997 [Gadus macrocephalus]